MLRIGIDLGGTKIEIATFDERGATLIRRRVPTPVGDYDATIDAIATLIADAERELGTHASVGVGTPGAASLRDGRIKNANSTWLIGRPFARDLAARLGREIRTANDANCFALSEACGGAAAGARVVFGVILGTGVGGGLAIDGRVHTGPNAIAGEWGHAPLPWRTPDELPGPRCYCGKEGCIETFLAGPAFGREPHLARYEDRLARALAMLVNVLDPDAIVLGGGVSNVAQLYDDLPALVARYAFSDTFETPIVRAAFGDSSGVRGAAMLWA